MPTRVAFVMKLNPGHTEEYRLRHDAAWPELLDLLKTYGIANYSIHLHEGTNQLFAILEAEDPARLDALPDEPLMRRWWEHMRDIMETEADGRPVQEPLVEVFHLP